MSEDSTGFMAVAHDRIKTLGAETLAELVKTDQLELIHLHLQSLRNFSAMTERMANRDATSGELPHGADSGQGAEGAKAEKEKASAEERSGQSAKPQAAKHAK